MKKLYAKLDGPALITCIQNQMEVLPTNLLIIKEGEWEGVFAHVWLCYNLLSLSLY